MHLLAVSLQDPVCWRQRLSKCTRCTWCVGLRNWKETKMQSWESGGAEGRATLLFRGNTGLNFTLTLNNVCNMTRNESYPVGLSISLVPGTFPPSMGVDRDGVTFQWHLRARRSRKHLALPDTPTVQADTWEIGNTVVLLQVLLHKSYSQFSVIHKFPAQILERKRH